MRLRRHMVAIAGILAAGASVDCSTLSNSCGALMPTLVASQSKLADVKRALDEIESSGVRDFIAVQSNRERFNEAVTRARNAYDTATRATAVAVETCTAPSIAVAMLEIADAWAVIRELADDYVTISDPEIAVEGAQ